MGVDAMVKPAIVVARWALGGAVVIAAVSACSGGSGTASPESQTPSSAGSEQASGAASGSSSASASDSPSSQAASTPAAASAASTAAPPPQADQTGVGSYHVSLSGHGPLALLTSRELQPDGAIRITWETTQAEVLEACKRGGVGSPTDRSKCDDPAFLAGSYGQVLGETGEAIVQCQTGTTTTSALNSTSQGQVRTLRRVSGGWLDESSGQVRDTTTAGGGGDFDSMVTAACDPGQDAFAHLFGGSAESASGTSAGSSAGSGPCPAGTSSVGQANGWTVCRDANGSISDGFATAVAQAVSGPGQYSGVVSPATGKAYYFACTSGGVTAGAEGLPIVVCGGAPTNIDPQGFVTLVRRDG